VKHAHAESVPRLGSLEDLSIGQRAGAWPMR
jgi:hypothetical protein